MQLGISHGASAALVPVVVLVDSSLGCRCQNAEGASGLQLPRRGRGAESLTQFNSELSACVAERVQVPLEYIYIYTYTYMYIHTHTYRPQSRDIGATLRPRYIPYPYMDPLGRLMDCFQIPSTPWSSRGLQTF